METSTRTTLGWGFWGLGVAFKGLFVLSAVALPLLGIWIASSLAAFHDGPMWLSLLVGALCFPLLPLVWELFATWRRRRKTTARPAILTWLDRLVLRTLFINLAFVGGLLAMFPSTVFSALSSRGDWILDHADATWAASARDRLFAGAESLAWLHEWTHPNEFEHLVEADYTRTGEGGKAPTPGQSLSQWAEELRGELESEATPASLYSGDRWPFRNELHPLVTAIPADSEVSIEAVATYIVRREDDPVQRVKALHDYVANRVAYDVPSYRAGTYPPQDAQSVFERRTGVCAGSANLLAALGEAAGLEIVVVVGDARKFDGDPTGTGHAWNAARIGERWYLMDPTWDAGHVSDVFTKEYKADFFMTPPEVFGISHMPDDAKWQLVAEPVTRGQFLRGPDLRPNFFAHGFELQTPDRAVVQVDAGSTIRASVTTAYGFTVSGSVFRGDTHLDWCDASPKPAGGTVELSCRVPNTPGDYSVALFGPNPGHEYMGQLHLEAS